MVISVLGVGEFVVALHLLPVVDWFRLVVILLLEVLVDPFYFLLHHLNFIKSTVIYTGCFAVIIGTSLV